MQHESYEVTPRDQGRAFAALYKLAKSDPNSEHSQSLMRVAMALTSESAFRVLEGEDPGPAPFSEMELKCIGLREQHAREVAAGESELAAAARKEAADALPAPGQPVPTPALIVEVLSELAFYGTDLDLTFAAERILETSGLMLAAGIAARRAYHRLGEFSRIVDHLERFFAFVPAAPITVRLRAIIADVRSGKVNLSPDDGSREKMQEDVTALAEGQSPGVQCLAHVAFIACWRRWPSDHELVVTRDTAEIAEILAEAFGEGAALEFAHSFETLGREPAGGAR